MTAPTIRAVRGATTVSEDRAELIVAATAELVAALLTANRCTPDDVVSAYFTVTADLRSEFPAKGARIAGWGEVPMLCAQEIPVAGALPRCIRVLLHLEVPAGTRLTPCYLGRADALRPDLAGRGAPPETGGGTFPACPPSTPPGSPVPPASRSSVPRS